MAIDKNGNHGLNGGLVTSYLVAHLATYPVEGVKIDNVVADAEKKLSYYESKDRLWPQNLIMRVDEYVLQLETPPEESLKGSEVVEKIPIQAIQLCSTAKDLKKQKEILLVLTKPAEGNEMYCFSCLGIWAKEIQDDINAAISDSKRKSSIRPGTLSRQKQRREHEGVDIDIIPPPPSNPPPALPVSNSIKRRLDDLRKIQQFHKPAEQSFGADAMDYETVFVYRVDRNVQILNHCLDDIEVFISRLQKASQAALELSERRKRRSTKGSKNGSINGEGIYSIRSKPPQREEYITTLAKLKFCFILLGELYGHINNPSSTDLIHFLFKPLNIIVQSCRGPELAQTVLTPLHTEKCLRLMRENMSSQEAELFFSLGEKWTKSRESWPNADEVVDYMPTFNNGWMLPPNNPPPSQHPDVLLEQHQPEKDDHRVRVLRDFIARDEMELSVRADEVLVVEDDSRKWWHCRNELDQLGYVPSNLLIKVTPHSLSGVSSEAALDDERSTISSNAEQNGYERSAAVLASTYIASNGVKSSSRSPSDITPPPSEVPPPPAMLPPSAPPSISARSGVTAAAILAAKQSMNNAPRNNPVRPPAERREMTDTFKAELQRRVGTGGNREFVLPTKTRRLPEASISKKSSNREVKEWLKSLSFSEITVESLGELNGAQIFTLNKDELRQICDDEGNIVFSKLQIQQNLNEQKTGQELNAVLALRKQKTFDVEPQKQHAF